MFDWPDPSHTSPTSTSLTVIAALSFLPAIVIVYGPPDFSFANRTIHVPVASAVADFVWPLNFTVIFSPGSAVPQMGTCMPFCSTIWSPNKVLGFPSARAEAARNSVAQRDKTSRRVFIRNLEWHRVRAGAATDGETFSLSQKTLAINPCSLRRTQERRAERARMQRHRDDSFISPQSGLVDFVPDSGAIRRLEIGSW